MTKGVAQTLKFRKVRLNFKDPREGAQRYVLLRATTFNHTLHIEEIHDCVKATSLSENREDPSKPPAREIVAFKAALTAINQVPLIGQQILSVFTFAAKEEQIRNPRL